MARHASNLSGIEDINIIQYPGRPGNRLRLRLESDSIVAHMVQHNNNKNPIDDIDQRIIEALQQDGRRPFTKIAADLGISEASVRQRVANLINNQVMQIVAVTNPIKLGFSLASMIGIRVSGDRLLEVAQEISAFDEVIYLILCTGSFDILAEVVCRDNDHLLSFLTEKLYKVQGVQQAETYMYLRVCKDTGTAVRLFPPFPRTVNLGE